MKFMNKKRFASLALAGAMAVSMAAPAVAADQNTVITATYQETELAVTVPATASAIINPYGLPVTMEDAVTSISGQPITMAAPLVIENQSAVALKVGANVKTVLTGITALETAANKGTVAGDTTGKKIYVEFQAFTADGVDGTSAADPTVTNPKFAALKDSDAVLKAVLDASTAGVDATGDLVLREGKDAMSQDGGVAFVRLSGVAAKKPATDWAETDKFVTTITYSFEPSTYTKSAGTITGAGSATDIANGGDLTVTLAPDLPDGVTVATWAWESSAEATATVAPLTDTKNAKVTNALANTGTSDTSVTITATGVGSDNITYTASITLNAKGNA